MKEKNINIAIVEVILNQHHLVNIIIKKSISKMIGKETIESNILQIEVETTSKVIIRAKIFIIIKSKVTIINSHHTIKAATVIEIETIEITEMPKILEITEEIEVEAGMTEIKS
jgi:hypothetical protein